MRREREGLSIRALCQIAGYSFQAYYKRLRACSESEEKKVILRELVGGIREHEPFCGGRKLHHRLAGGFEFHGFSIGRDRFFDFLREEQALVKYKKSGKNTTYSKHNYAVAPNVLKSTCVEAAEQAVVSDITYIRLIGSKFAYLFLVSDAYSRKILGWHLADNLAHEQAIKALEMAVSDMDDTTGIIHHSDRGVQYACHGYLDELRVRKMLPSMTDADHCYQNAIAERINGILKLEFMLSATFRSFSQAQAAVSSAIHIYNNRRPHWSLQLKTPGFVHKTQTRKRINMDLR
jgi:transposase InsO family protein